MSDAINNLTEVLRSNGYSLTAPRKAVLSYLLGREPVSVAALTSALTDVADRASVYRTIELFQKLGVIQRHNVGMKYTIELSDIFAEHHHHFTCVLCGKITPMSERALERFVEKLSAHYGFEATEHQFEIQGHCKSCRVKSARL